MSDNKNCDITIDFDEATELIKAETIRRILPGAFHEMNNHVTAIMGYSELLLGEMSGPKSVLSDLQNIQDGAAQLQELIRILSKLSSAGEEKTKGGFALVRTVEDTLRLLRKLVANKKTKVHFSPAVKDNCLTVGNESNFKIALSTMLVALVEKIQGEADVGMAISLNSDKEIVLNVSISEKKEVSGIPSRVEAFPERILSSDTSNNVCRAMIEEMGGKLLFLYEEDQMIGFSIALLRSGNVETKSYLDNYLSFEPEIKRQADKGC